MRELLSHLLFQGYTRPLLISSLDEPFPNYFKQELACFNEFMSENKLEGKILLEKEKGRTGLLEELDDEVKNAASQTVFIADSRFLTIKLLELFYANGKNMPRDAGLVGSHIIADYTEPKLTAKRISFYNFGETAVDMIDKIWKNKNNPLDNVMQESRIMKNGSTQRT
jgi:DNA-binding LacI/PurR family transcriptional regulator